MSFVHDGGRNVLKNLRDDREWLVLATMIVLWVVVFGRLVLLRHNRFGSFSLDMGIFDQATWLVSRFDGLFMSVRGLEFWGHHASPGFLLLAPFYRLGAGPNFLNLVMVLSMALGALPVFLLGRERLGGRWLPIVPAAAYLLHPSLQFMAWELFHPEVMAITPLFFAWWLARRQRWWWVAICVVYAISWKEDVALAVVMFGLVLLLRKQWRPGVLMAGLSAAWFLFVNTILVPGFSGADEAFYNNLYGHLGGSPVSIVFGLIAHPTRLMRAFSAPDAITFLWKMTASFGFVPLGAPAALALGVPQTMTDVLSNAGFTRVITYHYAALPLVGLTLGAVEGLVTLRRRPQWMWLASGVMLASAMSATLQWGPSPIGAEYNRGWWPHHDDPTVATKRAAIGIPPADGHISATYNLLPHMSRRRFAYSFPNPWISDNWGVNGENLDDPNLVDWLVIDRRLLQSKNLSLVELLLERGEFAVVYDVDGVFVAKRQHRGPRVTERDLAEGLLPHDASRGP